MTHFTVTVIGDDVEDILEPYYEGKEVQPYISNTPEDMLRQFKKYEIDCFKHQQDGETLSNFEIKTIALNLKTSLDLSDWWREYSGGDIDEDGNATSTYNPDSKWDWYSLGGRWAGMLPIKKGKAGTVGTSGVFGNKPKSGGVDKCRIKDVDWKQVRKDARVSAGNDWDELFNPVLDPDRFCMYNKTYLDSQKKVHMQLYGTRDEYIRRRGYWTTYALVSAETGWIAPGEMGWFGMHSDETADRDEYCKRFVSILKSLPKNTVISVVDCHI